MGGVSTIEHGDNGTLEIFKLMKEKGVCLCPTLAAGDAVSQYRGWKKGKEPEPERIQEKRKTFKMAMDLGVRICMGGDVGVFPHGDNTRELEMMVQYGMKPIDVLRSSTSINAESFKIKDIGMIRKGFLADILIVEGNPVEDILDIRKVKLVVKDGVVVR